MKALGLQVILEVKNCHPALIDDTEKLREILYRVARRSGMTPLKDAFHTFNPHGVSGVVILQESHVSIHTWPEFGYAAVDFFTCNLATDVEMVKKLFYEELKPTHLEIKTFYRGQHVLEPQAINS